MSYTINFNGQAFILTITSNTGDIAYIGYFIKKPSGRQIRAAKKTARPHIRNF